MCCTQLAEHTGCKNQAKNCHLHTIAQLCRAISSQLRHVSTIGKKFVKLQYLLHMSSQYGELCPLMAEISWQVWGTPANFNGFCVLASLLYRHRSTEVNQTFHDVWPSPGLVYYVYIFWAFCLLTEFCQVQNSLCVRVLRSAILVALLHGTRAVGVCQTLHCGIFTRHGGRPVRHWAVELYSSY